MLDKPLKLKRQIEKLENEIEELSTLSGLSLSVRVQTSNISDSTGDRASKIADKNTELRELKKAYAIVIGKLAGYFDSLDELIATVMRLRFVDGLSTYAIARKVGKSRTWVSRQIKKERIRLGGG